MKSKEGAEWKEQRAREWQKYEGNKMPLSHYHRELQKLMVESDNKRAEKKGRKK